MKETESLSLKLARSLLKQKVTVSIDRPLGSKHPKWGFEYPVNYGYIAGVKAPDGEDLDAYVLLVNEPLKSFQGVVTAIVHRKDNDDDKLVVIPEDKALSDAEIEKLVHFQEKWFKHTIVRG